MHFLEEDWPAIRWRDDDSDSGESVTKNMTNRTKDLSSIRLPAVHRENHNDWDPDFDPLATLVLALDE